MVKEVMSRKFRLQTHQENETRRMSEMRHVEAEAVVDAEMKQEQLKQTIECGELRLRALEAELRLEKREQHLRDPETRDRVEGSPSSHLSGHHSLHSSQTLHCGPEDGAPEDDISDKNFGGPAVDSLVVSRALDET